MGKCVLCNANATINTQDNASRTIYNCQSCGVFVLSDLAAADAKRHNCEISAYLCNRKLAGHNEIVLISFDKAAIDKDYLQLTVDQIVKMFPQSFSDQAEKVIMNLAHLSSYAGEEIRVEDLTMCPTFFLRKFSYDALSFAIKSLQKFDLLEVNYYGSSFFPCGIIVSPNGWDQVARLSNGEGQKDVAMIYLPGEEDQFTDSFHNAANKAAQECGYQVAVMNPKGSTNKIDYEMIGMIKSSKFVICGMTNATGAAYYTAAMASALGKQTILTCNDSYIDKLEINTEQISVLTWKNDKGLYLQILNAIRALVSKD